MRGAWAARIGVLALLGCGTSGPAAGVAGDAPREVGSGAGATASAPAASTLASASPSGRVAAPVASAAPVEPVFARPTEVARILRGGLVIDGTGAPGRVADVVIDGGRIVHVGVVDPAQRARAVDDVRGQVVAPGFVDAHAHADPLGEVSGLLAQGVTTVVIGQDGLGARDVGAQLRTIEAGRPRVNVATLVGHATARLAAGIGGKRAPSDAELARLRAQVERGMDAGAFGLSLGLEYEPGSLASAAELCEAARPAGARRGVVMAHLRSEDDGAIEGAIDELLDVARCSGAGAHVAHVKVVLGRGAARADAVLGKLAAARASGLAVTADAYPYDASYTSLSILFPPFAKPPHAYAEAKAKRRDELLAHLRRRVTERNGPGATLFGTGEYAGKRLDEVARARGVPFEEVLAALGPNGASAAYFVMDEAVMERLVADPFVMLGTDGGGGAHPRGAGAFARVMGRLVRERRVLSLEEAVRKAAHLPAVTLGWAEERGRVAPGQAADLVVFDAGEIADRATFEAPHRLAKGVVLTMVGGEVAFRAGRVTDARGGAVLRSKRR